MHPLSWPRLTLIAVMAALLSWTLARLADNSGATPARVPWSTAAVCLLVSAAVISLAWSVRQYRAGKRPDLDPLRAARTAVLAQAAAYSGALLMGAFGGYAASLAADWGHEPRREVAIMAMIAAGGALVLLVAGVVGEHWCKVGGDDDDEGTGPSAAGVAH